MNNKQNGEIAMLDIDDDFESDFDRANEFSRSFERFAGSELQRIDHEQWGE